MLPVARFLIRLYQCTLSPLLRLLTGAGAGCRFQPSCSEYFLQALETHGFFRGSWLGLKRLARCQPWGGSGHDPVPPRDGPEHRAVPGAASGHSVDVAEDCV